MTTSGVTSLSLTAREVVKRAMKELGALAIGEEPEAAELEDGILSLNMMLKTWGQQDNLFREESGTMTVPGGVAAAALPSGVRSIVGLWHIESATNERMLTGWNRMQYYSMPNRAAVGKPTIFYASTGRDQDDLYLWPVSATDVELRIIYNRSPEVVTDGDETLDVPEDWIEAVVLGLAARMAPMLGASDAAPQRVAQIEARAGAAYQMLLDLDRPDSYFFEPYDG